MLHAQTESETTLTEWRHYLHRHPETGFQERYTADFVAKRLSEFGVEVHREIGGTGLIGVLRRGRSGRTIGIRADMDALPMHERAENRPHRSQQAGRMHACGHDGHMAMVLGAARLLSAETFDGTVQFVFQPAEEHGKGARAMIDDGLLSRFPMDEIYGMHNMPGLPEGRIGTRPGGIMAAEDNFTISVEGRGTHSARPHMGRDPLVAGAELVLALQTIVARTVDPADSAVVSVTGFSTDGLRNAIPSNATITGDTRSYSPLVQQLLEKRMEEIVGGICDAHGVSGNLRYTHEFRPTINPDEYVAYAAEAAAKVVGASQVDTATPPLLASEDFGTFLEHIPGNFAFIGNGVEEQDGGAPLHSANYDFNDRILPIGARYFATVALDRLRA